MEIAITIVELVGTCVEIGLKILGAGIDLAGSGSAALGHLLH
jgi:hypothetical protein